ncbi:MAG: AraC family transcriptional regulator [Chitinophagaceae bacterium]|nr:AraC family transcriptional regulator [Chitinophagaceae bacterium]MDP1762723.1 helix-turn-helix domain-containing protein [Sediminibacterium sp.]MDP1810164.1 helix-turn-helix domain-containing protein [Sediminibacterium sp.]MDP3127870.1 helix-turn-helix domain-containing protein [Sediminibacterium sp.]MDP3666084.1 helix-turn-helix domain-containing protein [Sediminibacterium sp.]
MTTPTALTLVNPQNGNLAFKLFSFGDDSYFNQLQRKNYYSLIWITEGKGKVKADFSEYDFEQKTLFAFSPYQPFMLSAEKSLTGTAIQFHPDFYCIHMHQKEVACNGVLFNNIYQPPFTFIDDISSSTLNLLTGQMKTEMQNPALAQYELLVSYLKIFLITASRLKIEQQPKAQLSITGFKEPFVLQKLKDAIEKDFKTKHSASDYASMLNISARALAKITKTHFNKTLTKLISERIIIEAKRELYLTNKAIKEIAYELGYDDEYYFSRFFKANADISPQMYRDTVGFGRGIA